MARAGSKAGIRLVATKLGVVRRVVCASPTYVTHRGRPRSPGELAHHRCISFSALTPTESWSFSAGRPGGRARRVRVLPFLTINTAEAAIASARAGSGITTALSYQVANDLASGRLVPLLSAYAPDPVPVHLVCPARSATAAKVRAFIALAVPRLRDALAHRAPRKTRS